MDIEIDEELKEMRNGFEEMKRNGEFPNLDIDSIMLGMRKSFEEEKEGKLYSIEELLSEIKSKYLKTGVC